MLKIGFKKKKKKSDVAGQPIATKVKTICNKNTWITNHAFSKAESLLRRLDRSTLLTCYSLERTEGYRNVNEKPKRTAVICKNEKESPVSSIQASSPPRRERI